MYFYIHIYTHMIMSLPLRIIYPLFYSVSLSVHFVNFLIYATVDTVLQIKKDSFFFSV